MIRTDRLIRSWAVLVSLPLLAAAPAEAQVLAAVRNWPVDSVLARLEADTRSRTGYSLGAEATLLILRLPESYSARKDSLLNGLEQLSLHGRDGIVRGTAAGWIASAGAGGTGRTPVPGVMHRLMRVYRTTPHFEVRHLILDQLPLQAERAAAIALLRSIASEPDPNNDGRGPHGYFSLGDPRTEALARLTEMGEEGRAVLQAMHRSGEVRSPQGRIMLEDLARRGFPVTDAGAHLRLERHPSPP